MIDRLESAWKNPAIRAKLLWRLWIISTGFTLFGFAVIFYLALFPR